MKAKTGKFVKVVSRDFARARKDLDDIAARGLHATLASGAIAARVASGMFAGIADTLARKTTRKAR